MAEVSTSVLGVSDLKTIYNLEVAGTDYFHIDVMDGIFVERNNSREMLNFAGEIKQASNLPLDVHLMVKDVEEYIDIYSSLEPNIITFHYEANCDKDIVMKRINRIKECNARVGISIKPDTEINNILEFLPHVHIILIMTVEPGKGGQSLINKTVDKVKELNEYIIKNNIEAEIEVDGGINSKNVDLLKKSGASIIVSGTGIIESENMKDTIERFKL